MPILAPQVKPGTAELEDVAQFAFLKPKNSLSSKHILRKFFFQKMFELLELKGAIALKRDGHKTIIF